MENTNYHTTRDRKSYVLTVVSTPCVVSAVMNDGERVPLQTAENPGQYFFVAISDRVEISQKDAILRETFNSASLGGSSTGGGVMRNVVIPAMPDEGVDLVSGVNLTVTQANNNLFIKSYSPVGEMRLMLIAESPGVLNVIAPVGLKWLNGNKTHYVNAGDTVAASICNGLITVGSYS